MNYLEIKTDRQFKDTTGFSKKGFSRLLLDYERTFLEEKGQSYERHIEENSMIVPKLKTLGDALFFVLFQKKNDLIWGSLGYVFGMAASTAHENFRVFVNLLELTLEKKSDATKAF